MRLSLAMGALVPCVVVSLSYILLTMFLAESLRKLTGFFIPDKYKLFRTAVLEFVAGAELCGCGFELIISKKAYYWVHPKNREIQKSSRKP